MLKELVGNVQTGAEGLREAGSCWQGCQEVSTMTLCLSSEAISRCKCALEGKPEQGQEQGQL